MSKLKTHKSASKRLKKLTGRKQFIARAQSAQHRTTGKSPRVQQRSTKQQTLSRANTKRLQRLVPYL